jgi:hypothetical protein
MANNQPRDKSGIQSVDPTRGGTGRSDGSLASGSGAVPAGIDEVQQFLEGMDYPASNEELIDYARKRFAPLAILDQLEQLPPHEFGDFAEVSDALFTIYHRGQAGNR